jgi:hypothetical protein
MRSELTASIAAVSLAALVPAAAAASLQQESDLTHLCYNCNTDVLRAADRARQEGQFTGEITAIDYELRAVSVTEWIESRQFWVSPACEIVTEDDPDASLEDLAIGDPVTVSYRQEGTLPVAYRIEVRTEDSFPLPRTSRRR